METHALETRSAHLTTAPPASLTRREKCPQNITLQNALEKLNDLNLNFRFGLTAGNFFARSWHNLKLIGKNLTLAYTHTVKYD